LTLRQKLEKHRDNASCRDCHAKIDPWGLAFQQYSALGEFMKKQDASTTLPDGKEIKGISSLKAYLGKDKMEQVATSVTEHLLAYALGRSLSYLDEDDVHDLVQQTKKQGYGFKDLLKNVIEHELFSRS
jgi:hypothetical protein